MKLGVTAMTMSKERALSLRLSSVVVWNTLYARKGGLFTDLLPDLYHPFFIDFWDVL